MNMRLFLLAALLCLALSAPAFAEIKTFNKVKIDVPAGWTSVAEGTGVILVAPDRSASVTVDKFPSDGLSLAAAAQQSAQALNSKAEPINNKAYLIQTQSSDGVPTLLMLVDEKGDAKEYTVIAVAGNHDHPDINGIMKSLDM